jgi:hypothetical protein
MSIRVSPVGNLELIRNIILALGGIPGLMAVLLIPVLYKKIVKPFDRIFWGQGSTFEHGVWFFSVIMRLSQYTLCIVFPKRSKNDAYARSVYKGYDFRGNASSMQIKLSYVYVYGLVIAIFFSFVLIVYDFGFVPMFG